MGKSKKKLVALTTEQLRVEGAQPASGCQMIDDRFLVHIAEPIPDHDWVGGTWGLYWSDYEDELRELLEQDTQKYIRKHQEDKVVPGIHTVNVLTCPAIKKVPVQKTLQLNIHPPVKPSLQSDPTFERLGTVHDTYQLFEDARKFIRAHVPSISCSSRVTISTPIECLTCQTVTSRKEVKDDLQSPKLPDNALHPSLPDVKEQQSEDATKESTEAKWDWMKENKTKFRLSMYW